MTGAGSPGSATPARGAPATAAGTSPVADEMDAPPLPPLGGLPEAESPAVPARSEVEAPAAMAPAPDSTGDLPPLPADLGRDAATTPPTVAAPQPATGAIPAASEPVASPAPAGSAVPHTEDDPLPPLPMGIEAPAPIATTPAPIATTPAPVATATTTAPEESPHNAVDPDAAAPAVSSPTNASAAESQGVAVPESTVAPESTAAPTGGTNPVADADPTPATGADSSNGTPSDTTAAKADPTSPAPAGNSPGAATQPISADINFTIPERAAPVSILNDDLRRKVEEVARNQEREDELRHLQQNRAQADTPQRDNSSLTLQTQTQLDISRAPSPAEARPIKAIPVPEDWVPLAARNWAPQRKYWSAAATCHLPLYFQDPVLERYGHSVEQFVGPAGRFLTYPVDDPSQSTQRNQIVQPFFSWGLFALQIAAWPYNAIMDPPWEAQYDLGYYRPGDVIPLDTYWLPLHGYGPPLRGNRY